jgi:hypothetical protein
MFLVNRVERVPSNIASDTCSGQLLAKSEAELDLDIHEDFGSHSVGIGGDQRRVSVNSRHSKNISFWSFHQSSLMPKLCRMHLPGDIMHAVMLPAISF